MGELEKVENKEKEEIPYFNALNEMISLSYGK